MKTTDLRPGMVVDLPNQGEFTVGMVRTPAKFPWQLLAEGTSTVWLHKGRVPDADRHRLDQSMTGATLEKHTDRCMWVKDTTDFEVVDEAA